MRLSNDEASWNELSVALENYYRQQGRFVSIFSAPMPETGKSMEFCFLIDKTHVARYLVGMDRGEYLGILQLAIGPHYFSPSDFWSYEASQRFTLEASTEGMQKNLQLLDEFLGIQ